MKQITLGTTGITVPQNAFGALPIQRMPQFAAVGLVRKAYEGGMRLFDTARAYSDSEIKVGLAFAGMRHKVYITTKTTAKIPKDFWVDLDKSLTALRTDYIDIYQFHCVDRCYRPGDGTGMYECMLEAKAQGRIRHIGVTTHQIDVAYECVQSGLYETVQFPFSYLSGEPELKLVQMCKEHNVGFIAMKGLAGGLITRYDAAMAFMTQFDNVLPIWGVQRAREIDEWLSCMDDTPEMTDEIRQFIEQEQENLAGDFCRGCGYCMPCPQGISIRDCARMSLMVRRAPSENWLTEKWQAEMKKIETCINCRQCTTKCPYQLDTPELLKKNLEDYNKILAGEIIVS